MRISQVQIENYRGIKDLTLSLDDYTALIGPNGVGKSTVLYALAWFFDGGTPEEADCYRGPAVADEPKVDAIGVTVTFADLTARDREILEKYGRDETAVFRRTWSPGEPKSKIFGNALQGPGFSSVRAPSLVGEQRSNYASLRERLPGLPDLGTRPAKAEIEEALRQWEEDPQHSSELETVPGEDASHLFGAVGTSVIGRLVRFVLVPASIDMASQLGTADKKAALSELVGAMVAATSERVQAQWLEKHGEAVDELHATMTATVTTSTQAQADRINGLFSQFVPSAAVKLTPAVAPLNSRMDVKVLTEVEIDGFVTDISRQGHGVQRAVMMTTLQAMVPEDVLDEPDAGGEGEAVISTRPHLIIAIEEPEIFQHPLRARNFARVLTELAADDHTQVLVATHSPYFVRPEQFAALRRFHRDGRVVQATVDEIAAASGLDAAKLAKNIGQKLPTAFSEAFFSDHVVLVEGDTDQGALEGLCELLGNPLIFHDIAVVEAGSKTNLRTTYEILTSLGINTYVVVDGDFGEELAGTQAYGSREAQTAKILAWLPGGQATAFGDPSYIGERFACWQTDLEAELGTWPSFNTALQELGGAIGKKYASHYRAAALLASDEDMPESLRLLAARLRGLAGPDETASAGVAVAVPATTGEPELVEV